jgi:hypothetical protein
MRGRRDAGALQWEKKWGGALRQRDRYEKFEPKVKKRTPRPLPRARMPREIPRALKRTSAPYASICPHPNSVNVQVER